MITKFYSQMQNSGSYGTLFIVATPIGNLDDMTFRAVDTLKGVDLIAAEDTRHSSKLLNHYGISSRLVSCHEHNEEKKIKSFITDLESGKDIALISDAGTPTISDPGYRLVAAASEKGIPIIPIPGCSAAVAGLSVSGLPTNTFMFIGFLPKKKTRQTSTIEGLKQTEATLIFYESPKRIQKLLSNLISILGDRQCCLAREMTKLHEEYLKGQFSEVLSILSEKPSLKGECALFVEGHAGNDTPVSEEELNRLIRENLSKTTGSTSDLARHLAKLTLWPRKAIYNRILDLKNSD